ncbi:hypothetical protein M0R19_06335 [Candidatus Pacearchaeota archaeon]|jgi:flagellar basal body-associated protein FliL|nr:hypothetical protein [Candidatus Pacearchaeota archaeon]
MKMIPWWLKLVIMLIVIISIMIFGAWLYNKFTKPEQHISTELNPNFQAIQTMENNYEKNKVYTRSLPLDQLHYAINGMLHSQTPKP